MSEAVQTPWGSSSHVRAFRRQQQGRVKEIVRGDDECSVRIRRKVPSDSLDARHRDGLQGYAGVGKTSALTAIREGAAPMNTFDSPRTSRLAFIKGLLPILTFVAHSSGRITGKPAITQNSDHIPVCRQSVRNASQRVSCPVRVN